MPGAAREPAHIHFYDEVVLEVPMDFTIVCCKICGHYIIVTPNKHRCANRIEAELVRQLFATRMQLRSMVSKEDTDGSASH